MDKNPVLLSKLSLESDIPLYSQLVNIIKRNITAGTLNPGDQLPSESELCKNFDISRSTVRQAVETEYIHIENSAPATEFHKGFLGL